MVHSGEFLKIAKYLCPTSRKPDSIYLEQGPEYL